MEPVKKVRRNEEHYGTIWNHYGGWKRYEILAAEQKKPAEAVLEFDGKRQYGQ